MAYDAYRFEHTRPDANASGGKRHTIYIAVAQSYEEAAKLVADISPNSTRYVARGGQNLEIARAAGIADGQAGVVF